MIITKCDRCGAEKQGKFEMSQINFYNETKTTYEWDLCPKCINELAGIVKEWVEKYGKNRD